VTLALIMIATAIAGIAVAIATVGVFGLILYELYLAVVFIGQALKGNVSVWLLMLWLLWGIARFIIHGGLDGYLSNSAEASGNSKEFLLRLYLLATAPLRVVSDLIGDVADYVDDWDNRERITRQLQHMILSWQQRAPRAELILSHVKSVAALLNRFEETGILRAWHTGDYVGRALFDHPGRSWSDQSLGWGGHANYLRDLRVWIRVATLLDRMHPSERGRSAGGMVPPLSGA
jgi:hypothetical protein